MGVSLGEEEKSSSRERKYILRGSGALRSRGHNFCMEGTQIFEGEIGVKCSGECRQNPRWEGFHNVIYCVWRTEEIPGGFRTEEGHG